VLASVESTNTEAFRAAPSLSEAEWIFAHQQTKGRGRHGRRWRDPEGNFAATLIMQLPGPAAHLALRSFVAALAVYDALVACGVPSKALSLKWPNDVLLDDGKIAGILLESRAKQGRASGNTYDLAIGIGVNLRHTPDQAEGFAPVSPPVSLYGQTGIAIAPEGFLNLLAARYAPYEQAFRQQGFHALRLLWLERAARLGTPITARLRRDTQTGIFETVDSAGNLVLKTEQGILRISAAEVFF